MDWLDEIEAEAAKRKAEAEAQDADPAYQARMAAKKAAEFERGVRLGWWDAEGEPIAQPEDDEDDEDGDTDEDAETDE